MQAVAGGGRTLRAEELSGDVEGLAADDHNLLAVEQLLGHGAGQAAKQVALAVDDDYGLEGRHPARIAVGWWWLVGCRCRWSSRCARSDFRVVFTIGRASECGADQPNFPPDASRTREKGAAILDPAAVD